MQIECDAILFDNDGVLVDSHEQVDVAWRTLATEFELDIDAIWSELVGARSRDTLSRHLEPDVVDDAVERLERLEVELATHTQPLGGALDLIGQLGSGRWAIVTSASRRLAEARWNGAGVFAPAHTVTADDVSRGKPFPDPFVTGASRLGVDPARCVVFEDSAPGGDAGRAAGATVIAVGNQPWRFDPVGRVADLSQVRAETDGDGWMLQLSL